MKRFLALALLVVATAPLSARAGSKPCSLHRSILAAYDAAKPSLEAIGAARRAVSDFMSCDPAVVDEASRRVFFSAVEQEFSTDPTPQLEAWQKQYPDSEALWEGINIHQHELREYLDRLFDPVRDRDYKEVVLRFGKGHTIASLGPDAKAEVRQALGDGSRFYGLSKTYNPQFDALEALGYWIDPANRAFSPSEKSEMEKILTDLLAFDENAQPAPPAKRLVAVTLTSLAHSGDPRAGAAVQAWLEKRRNPNDELSRLARKTVAEIANKARK